jgi:hypothetical protein
MRCMFMFHLFIPPVFFPNSYATYCTTANHYCLSYSHTHMHLIPPIPSIHTSYLPTVLFYFLSQRLLLQYTRLTNTLLNISSHFSYMDYFFFLFLLLTFPFSFVLSLLRLHPCAFRVACHSFFFILGHNNVLSKYRGKPLHEIA